MFVLGTRLIVAVLALTAVVADAAPLPSPWERQQALELPIDAPQRLSPEIFQLTEEFLFLGVSERGSCGQVWIYTLDALLGQGSVEADWILEPDDKSRCARNEASHSGSFALTREVFGAGLKYSGERLVVADTSIEAPGPSAGQQLGRILVYEPLREDGMVVDWQLAHTIDQDTHDVATISPEIAVDERNIFFIEKRISDACFEETASDCDISVAGVPWLADDAGGFRLVGRIRAGYASNPSIKDIELAGDQLLLNDLRVSNTQPDFLEVINLNHEKNTWQSAQAIEIDAVIPEILRGPNGPIVSGDRMVVDGCVGSLLNCGTPALFTFARGPRDQWARRQLIENPERALFPFFSLVAYQVQGADMVAAWGFPSGIVASGAPPTHRLVHYRLNRAGRFEPIQTIDDLAFAIEPGEAVTEPMLAFDDRRLIVIRETADGGLELVDYRRGQGDTFAITRGITGGWSFGPGHDGQGAFLQVIGGDDGPRVLMLWATHDPQGNQMWLRGVGRIDVDRVRMELVRTGGARFGDAFEPADVQKQAWGEAQLVFDSCDTGTLQFGSESLGSGELPLRRVTAIEGLDCGDALGTDAAQRWTGSWYQPARGGEGVVLQLADTRGAPVLTSVWATYNQREQMWLYGDESLSPSADVLDIGDVIRPVGLPFSGDTDNGVMSLPWGRYRFSPLGCETIEFSYESDIAGFGTGTHRMQRLTTPLGLDCASE